MPNISNEDRKRYDEGNAIAYGNAKQTFLSLVMEEGYSKDDFKDFDEPCKPYIENILTSDKGGREKKKKTKKGANPLDE